MKILRSLLTFIISFILVILIVAFTIITTFKNILQNQLLGEAVKQTMICNTESITSDAEKSFDNIIGNEDASDVIDSIISDYTDATKTGNYEVSEKTLDLIIDYCVKNEKRLEDVSGSEMDIDELKTPEAREELRNSLNESFKEIGENSDGTVSSIIIGYGEITSEETQIKILVAIGLLIAIIAVLSLSLYKWMKPVGIDFITAGIFVSLIYGAISVLKTAVVEALELTIDLDVSLILKYGIGEIVIGIVLLVIGSVLKGSFESNKKPKKEDVKIDESEEFDEDSSDDIKEISEEELNDNIKEETDDKNSDDTKE